MCGGDQAGRIAHVAHTKPRSGVQLVRELCNSVSSREGAALVLLHHASALRKVRWTGAAFRAEAVDLLWLVRLFCFPRRSYGAALRPVGRVAECRELVPNEFAAHLEAGEVERLELQERDDL